MTIRFSQSNWKNVKVCKTKRFSRIKTEPDKRYSQCALYSTPTNRRSSQTYSKMNYLRTVVTVLALVALTQVSCNCCQYKNNREIIILSFTRFLPFIHQVEAFGLDCKCIEENANANAQLSYECGQPQCGGGFKKKFVSGGFFPICSVGCGDASIGQQSSSNALLQFPCLFNPFYKYNALVDCYSQVCQTPPCSAQISFSQRPIQGDCNADCNADCDDESCQYWPWRLVQFSCIP